jgi:hypothetical protein
MKGNAMSAVAETSQALTQMREEAERAYSELVHRLDRGKDDPKSKQVREILHAADKSLQDIERDLARLAVFRKQIERFKAHFQWLGQLAAFQSRRTELHEKITEAKAAFEELVREDERMGNQYNVLKTARPDREAGKNLRQYAPACDRLVARLLEHGKKLASWRFKDEEQPALAGQVAGLWQELEALDILAPGPETD